MAKPAIIEKYGLDEAEVIEWGKKRYPQFTKNLNILAQLYLRQVKNVSIDPNSISVMRGKKSTVAELKPGDWCIIEVLLGTRLRENSYTGCPTCLSKLKENLCPKCGMVEPAVHFWSSYAAGDNSGDIVISFPPKIANTNKDLEGKMIKLRGVQNDQGEFVGQDMEFIEEESPAPVIKPVTKPPKKLPGTRIDTVPKDTIVDSGVAAEEEPSVVETLKATVVQKEVDKIKRVLESFQPDYAGLVEWSKREKVTSKLDDLIEAAGGVIEDGLVKLK